MLITHGTVCSKCRTKDDFNVNITKRVEIIPRECEHCGYVTRFEYEVFGHSSLGNITGLPLNHFVHGELFKR